MFWGAGNITNSNGRGIQIWYNTINWKGIVEGVINVLYLYSLIEIESSLLCYEIP